MAAPTTTTDFPIDVIITNDHKEMDVCMTQFQTLYKVSPDEAFKWYNQLGWLLARHSVAEEIIFYPELQKMDVSTAKDLVKESLSDHEEVKTKVQLIEAQKNMDEKYKLICDLFTFLKKHHLKEEVKDIPLFVDKIPYETRIALGKRFLLNKSIAPTHLHGILPVTGGIWESFVSALLAPIDKFQDFFKSFPDTSVATQEPATDIPRKNYAEVLKDEPEKAVQPTQ